MKYSVKLSQTLSVFAKDEQDAISKALAAMTYKQLRAPVMGWDIEHCHQSLDPEAAIAELGGQN